MNSSQFLTALFDNKPAASLIELRTWFHAKQQTDRRLQSSFHKTIADVLAAAKKLEPTGRDICFGVAPRAKALGTKDGIDQVYALYADIDHVEAPPRFPLPPTITVRSGTGFHLYWKLTEPIGGAVAEATGAALAKYVKGDAVWDVSRVMRLPGFLNHKYNPPKLCEVVEDFAVSYSLDDLQRAATVRGKVVDAIYSEDHKGFESHSERDWAVMRALLGAHVSRSAILSVFEAAPVGSKFREEGQHYFEQTFTKAAEKPQQTPGAGQPFFEKNKQLFCMSPRGGEYCVATFVLEPTELVHSDTKTADALNVTLQTPDGSWPVSLPKKAFNNASSLNAAMPQASAIWLGSDRQTREYMAYLMQQHREGTAGVINVTSVSGRHTAPDGTPLWVTPDVTLTADGTSRAIVYAPNGREHPLTAFPSATHKEIRELATQLFKYLPDINTESVTWPTIGWFFAAPYKPTLLAQNTKFPHLDIFGTRGSGKSSLIRLMLRIAGLKDGRSYDSSTTNFVLLALLGSTNAIPISLTEFRLESKVSERVARHLLISYDAGRDARGHADQTTTEYALTAPIVLDGEDAVADPATKERTILVRLSPETIRFESAAEQAYKRIFELPIEKLAASYITYTLATAQPWQAAYDLTRAAFKTQPLPERVLNNMAVVTMGNLSRAGWLETLGIETPELTPTRIKCLFANVLANTIGVSGRTALLVDEFVESVVNLISTLEMRAPFQAGYLPDVNAVAFNVSAAYEWWVASRQRQHRAVLGLDAIRKQLEERRGTGPGQYVVPTIYSENSISLKLAHAAGLEIPPRISREKVFLLDMNTHEENDVK